MTKPVNLADAIARGLTTIKGGVVAGGGVHTFSNGSEWDCWSDANCYECRWYDAEGNAGEHCAFEAAAFMHCVTPELAQMFGWAESSKYPGSFSAPEVCPFLRKRGDDGGSRPQPKPHDPRQLVLLADPTEDAAMIQSTDVLQEVAP